MLCGPILAGAIVISMLSADAFAAENTRRFIIPILHWLFPTASLAVLSIVYDFIREGAHLVEYFLLSRLILGVFRAGKGGKRFTCAAMAILLVAVLLA